MGTTFEYLLDFWRPPTVSPGSNRQKHKDEVVLSSDDANAGKEDNETSQSAKSTIFKRLFLDNEESSQTPVNDND